VPENLPSPNPGTRARQRILLTALAAVLLLGGFVVLFALRRIPLPLRLLMGFGDFVAASALLLLVRQRFSGPPPPEA
jgi:hypothetical protein